MHSYGSGFEGFLGKVVFFGTRLLRAFIYLFILIGNDKGIN